MSVTFNGSFDTILISARPILMQPLSIGTCIYIQYDQYRFSVYKPIMYTCDNGISAGQYFGINSSEGL